MVEPSVTASRYVDCVVPCKSVEVEERLGVKAVRTADGSEGFVG